MKEEAINRNIVYLVIGVIIGALILVFLWFVVFKQEFNQSITQDNLPKNEEGISPGESPPGESDIQDNLPKNEESPLNHSIGRDELQ